MCPSLVPVSPMSQGPFWGSGPQREAKARSPSLDFLGIWDPQGCQQCSRVWGQTGHHSSFPCAVPAPPCRGWDYRDQKWGGDSWGAGHYLQGLPGGKSCQLPPNLPQNGLGRLSLAFFLFPSGWDEAAWPWPALSHLLSPSRGHHGWRHLPPPPHPGCSSKGKEVWSHFAPGWWQLRGAIDTPVTL